MSELPYLPLFIDDFEAATAHLSMLEDGAYNRLLRLCWRTPGCKLPGDETWIMRKLRAVTEDERAAVQTILAEFFTKGRGKIWSKRLLEIYLDKSVAHAKKVEAGKMGAAAKALKKQKRRPSKAKADLKQPDPDPDPEREKEEDVDVETRGAGLKPPAEPEPPKAPLFDRVLIAAGLNPNDIPSARWMPPAAEIEVNRWPGFAPGLLTDDLIVQHVEASVKRHGQKPSGPKAFEVGLKQLAAMLMAGPAEPVPKAPNGGPAPQNSNRPHRGLTLEEAQAAIERGFSGK